MTRRPAPQMAAGWAFLDGEETELDTTLPAQYHTRVAQWTPEQQLQAAVLTDAVRCLRKGRTEARRWFAGGSAAPGYTCADVCESLGLDHSLLVARLLQETEAT